jgi:hypothetical protein
MLEVPHLVPDVGGGLVVGDELGREEMPKIMIARSGQASLLGDRFPGLCVKHIRVDEATVFSSALTSIRIQVNGNFCRRFDLSRPTPRSRS